MDPLGHLEEMDFLGSSQSGSEQSKSMGQIYEEWTDSNSSSHEDQVDAPSTSPEITYFFSDPFDDAANQEDSVGTCTSRKNRKKMFKNDPVIDVRRCLFGYDPIFGKVNKKLLIRSDEDPDLANEFTAQRGTSGIQIFKCKCNHDVVAMIGDQVVIKEKKFVHGHDCTDSYRKLFFQFKLAVLIYGSIEEIEAFNRATYSKCDERGYTRVHQRDWQFLDSPLVDRHSVIFIRDEAKRDTARRYFLQSDAENTEKLLYVCPDCTGPKKATAILYKLPCGLHAVWEPPSTHHTNCVIGAVTDIADIYCVEVVDEPDMDMYRIVPFDEWEFGVSRSRQTDRRLIIKVPDGADMYYEYGIGRKPGCGKLRFSCTTCLTSMHRAFLKEQDSGHPRVVAPINIHDEQCRPKSLNDIMERQLKYKAGTGRSKKAKINEPKTQICRERFFLNGEETHLIITPSISHHQGNLFLIKDDDISKTTTRLFKCDTCPCIASLTVQKRGGRKIVRCESKHNPGCKLVEITDEMTAQQSQSMAAEEGAIENFLKRRHSALSGTKTKKRKSLKKSISTPNEVVAVAENEVVFSGVNAVDDVFDARSADNITAPNAAYPPAAIEIVVSKDEAALVKEAPVDEVDAGHVLSQSRAHSVELPAVIDLTLDDEPIKQEPMFAVNESDNWTAQNSVECNKLEFVSATNVWIRDSCTTLGIAFSAEARKVWAGLTEVVLDSDELPKCDKIESFDNGYCLISHLCTGSLQFEQKVKEGIGKFIFTNKRSIGVVDGRNFSDLDDGSVADIAYSPDLTNVHFAVISKMLKCHVISFDYSTTASASRRSQTFKSNKAQVPTVVIGKKDDKFFIFVD